MREPAPPPLGVALSATAAEGRTRISQPSQPAMQACRVAAHTLCSRCRCWERGHRLLACSIAAVTPSARRRLPRENHAIRGPSIQRHGLLVVLVRKVPENSLHGACERRAATVALMCGCARSRELEAGLRLGVAVMPCWPSTLPTFAGHGQGEIHAGSLSFQVLALQIVLHICQRLLPDLARPTEELHRNAGQLFAGGQQLRARGTACTRTWLVGQGRYEHILLDRGGLQGSEAGVQGVTRGHAQQRLTGARPSHVNVLPCAPCR